MTKEEQDAADAEAAKLQTEADDAKALEDEAKAEQAFSDGYTGTETVAKVLTPEEQKAAEDAKAESDAQAEADAKAAAAVEAAKVTPEPVTAQLPNAQLLDMVKKMQSVEDLVQKVRDDSAGRIGSLQHALKALQDATPTGLIADATEEDFAELLKEIPDVAPKIIQGLKRVFAKAKGVIPAPAAPALSAAEIEAHADARIAVRLQERDQRSAMNELTRKHADWQTVIGASDSKTEFRQWLDTQPHTFVQTFLNSWEPAVVSDAYVKFHEFKKGAAPAPVAEVVPKTPKPAVTAQSAREQRLREAVQPKGGASAPAKPREKTAEEQFEEGYTSK